MFPCKTQGRMNLWQSDEEKKVMFGEIWEEDKICEKAYKKV